MSFGSFGVPPFPPAYLASGLLLHLTSLPSPYGIGNVGRRMNLQGHLDCSWIWRCTEDMLSDRTFDRLRDLTKDSSRSGLTLASRAGKKCSTGYQQTERICLAGRRFETQ